MLIHDKKYYFNKKYYFTGFAILVAMVSICLTFNTETSIRQGINGKVSSLKMPLYVKIMDFWVREQRGILLVDRILEGSESKKEKLLALAHWTSQNIRPIPHGFPVVDDHVDNIIIRGYGTDDQSADVFTTLAVIAGFKSGIYVIRGLPEADSLSVSLVESDKKLLLFDTYNHFIFYNKKGEIASLDEIMNDINLVREAVNRHKISDKLEYVRYYENLKPVDKIGWTKADLQVSSKRLIYIMLRLLNLAAPAVTFYGDGF